MAAMSGIEIISLNEGYDESVGFHWADYLVFILTLAISLGVGLYTGCKGQKTTNDYLTGSKKLHLIPVALSIFMSVISGIIILGNSAEMYFYGTQLWLDCVGRTIFYTISATLFVPMMYRLRLTSVFEYHEKRYKSRALTLTSVIVGILNGSLYMGLAMFAPSTALEAVTGFPVWASIVCTGAVAVFYTTLGGIKAVVWTDFVQGFIMFAGLLVVLIVGCIKVGGLATVWEVSDGAGRIEFFNMDPDPTIRMTFWGAIFGSGLTALTQSGYEQSQVQRYCSLPNIKDAKRAVYLQGPLLISVFLLVCLCGLTAFAYYELLGCDPFRSGKISSSNQIVPYFLVDVVNYPGIPGIFVAVLFSGALSSISSSMSSLAAITWKDLIESHVTHLDEFRKTLITKVLAFIYGIIGITIGFLMQNLKGHVMQIATALLGGLYGPCAGIIMAGALFPCVQWKGGLTGFVAGLAMMIWMNIGQVIYFPHRSYLETNVDNCTFAANETALEIEDDLTDVFWLYRVSYIYIGPICWVITISIALVVSLITGRQDPKELDPMTVINLSDRFGWCCNEDQKEKFWCGVSYDELDKEATEEKEKAKKESVTESTGTKDDIQGGVEKETQMDNDINKSELASMETADYYRDDTTDTNAITNSDIHFVNKGFVLEDHKYSKSNGKTDQLQSTHL